jgi:hypothetical protein
MTNLNEYKAKILEAILKDTKDKKVAVAWNGSPESTLVWYLPMIDAGIKFNLVFADDDKHPIALYTHINIIQRRHKLNIKRVFANSPDTLEATLQQEAKKYDVFLTGKPTSFGNCPLPDDDRGIWNLIKTIRVPFYQPKRGLSGYENS